MNPEIKAEWIKALRSGEYEQTTGTLRGREGGYCCLGVLCEVLVQHNYTVERNELYGGYRIPYEVLDKKGLTSEYIESDGVVIEHELGYYGTRLVGITDDTENRLVGMNDQEGKNFTEIADYIEQNL